MRAAPWRAWIRRLFVHLRTRAARRGVRPWLEPLEDRTVPTVFTVNSLGDAGSGAAFAGDLRYCVSQANLLAGTDTIQFALGAGQHTILLGSQLTLADSVVIDAGLEQITVNGGGVTRDFQINAGVTATIDNLTIANGFAQFGGGIENDGVLHLVGCTLTGNQAIGGDGGDVISSSGGAGGGGAGMGGAIYNTGSLDLTNCTLTANQATGGAGGNVGATSDPMALPNYPGVNGLPGGGAAGGAGGTGDGVNAFSNPADPPGMAGGTGGFGGGGGGGGGSPFANGTASGGAGGGSFGEGSLGGQGGSATASWAGGGGGGAGVGGAIFNDGAHVTLTNSVFSGNTAVGGAGGYSYNPGMNGQGVEPDLFNNNGTVSEVDTLVIDAPTQIDEQDAVSVTAHVLDGYGNPDAGFTGVVHFTSDDPRASLPTDYTFTAADAGVHTFTGLRLRTPGDQTIILTSPGAVPDSADVQVADVAPTVTLNDVVIPLAVGVSLDAVGSFTDPDGTVWTATADYGDGKGPQALALAPDKSFHLQHVYTSEGENTVTVVVTDESGVASAPVSLRVEVFLPGTNSKGVGVAKASQGGSDEASAPGIDGTLYHNGAGDAFLLVTPLPPGAVGPLEVSASVGLLQAASYDVRGVNLSPADKVVVTFTYAAGGVAPVLRFFDPSTRTFRIIPSVVDLAKHTVTATFTLGSDPSVTALNGTVFTITVTPSADVIRAVNGNANAGATTNTTQSNTNSSGSFLSAVQNALGSAVGAITVSTTGVSGVDAGGGGAEDSTNPEDEVLGDLPKVKPDGDPSAAPPSTAVLSPSQSTLPDKSSDKPKKNPPDKKTPAPPKTSATPLPKSAGPGALRLWLSAPDMATGYGGMGVPASPSAVQRIESEKRHSPLTLAVDLLLAAATPVGIVMVQSNRRRRGEKKRRGKKWKQPGERGA